MSVRPLDRDFGSVCHLLTVGDIDSGDKDISLQGLGRKTVRPVAVGGGTPSENQTQCRRLILVRRRRRGERRVEEQQISMFSNIFKHLTV